MLLNMFQADVGILLWIQETCVNQVLTPFMKAVTYLGNGGVVWILTGIILCFWKKTRKAGILMLIALACSFIVNNLALKNMIARLRPYDVVTQVQLLISRQSDFSFPSGHTAASFAAAMVIARRLPKKYGITALLLAAAIGFSRIYLGVHYPSDVIFGAVSGALIGYFVERLSVSLDYKTKIEAAAKENFLYRVKNRRKKENSER